MENPFDADSRDIPKRDVLDTMQFLDEPPKTLEEREAESAQKAMRALGSRERTEDVRHAPDAGGIAPGALREKPIEAARETVAAGTYEKKPRESFEVYIGKRWLPVIGIVAIILGVGYLLNYAFDAGIIPPWGRILLGVVGGGILVAFGERLRSSYRLFANILYGGGIALFYLTTFAAYALYHIVGQATALALMSMVTGAAATVAVWHDAMTLAVFATIGGFITPLILFKGQSDPVTLFVYIALLTVGILITSYFKSWRHLNLLGIIGTILVFSQWYDAYYALEYLALTQFFLSIFFVEHLFALFFGCSTDTADVRKTDLVLITVVTAWFYSWTYYLLDPRNHDLLGPATILLAAAFAALGWVAYTMKRTDKNLYAFLFGIATIFAVLVVPVQFDANIITIGWAAEGVVIAWIGFMNASPALRATGIVVLMLAVLRLLVWDAVPPVTEQFKVIMNQRFFTFGVVVLAIGALHGLYARFRTALLQSVGAEELRITPVLAAAWTILLFTLLNMEMTAYFEYKTIAASSGGAMSLTAAFVKFRNVQNAYRSVLWSLFASGLLGIGVLLGKRVLRLAGLWLFAATIVKIFVLDLWDLPGIYRFMSLVVLGILLLVVSYTYHRLHGEAPPKPATAA